MTIEHYAKQGTYKTEPAIMLKHGRYSAALLPRIGGNLISFRDDDNGYKFIREPEGTEWEGFLNYPMVHGIPVLFPPNRYDGGQFEFDGRAYKLPVNEEKTGNHLHGFVFNKEWEVVSAESSEEKSAVTVRYVFDESDSDFAYWPHRCTLTHTYSLSADGLTETFEATNDGDTAMPLMIGFHTTVNAPFAPGSTVGDLECGVAIADRWELSERMLPTGRTLPLDEGELALQAGKGNPYYAELDNHYSATRTGVNAATIYDKRANVRFVYEAGGSYKHWMIYNGAASGKFFCPEPQAGMVDAPNVPLPQETTGLIRLDPGQSWSAVSRLYTE